MKMRDQKQILSEMQFAFKNGHKNVSIGNEQGGEFYIFGTFGYIVTKNKKFYNDMMSLVNSYNVNVYNTVAEIQAEIKAKNTKELSK